MRSASSGGWPRPFRWSLWLTVGVAVGLLLGFALGLTRPRVRVS